MTTGSRHSHRWGGLVMCFGAGCLFLSGSMLTRAYLAPEPNVSPPGYPFISGDFPAFHKTYADIPKTIGVNLQRTRMNDSSGVESVVARGKTVWTPTAKGDWLTILIPSISRGNVDYVSITVRSILDQVEKYTGDKNISILIVDNTPAGKHDAIEGLLARYGESKSISFNEQPRKGRVDEGSDPDKANKPGARVRRQTRDLVYTLRQFPSDSAHVLVMEDDFFFCPHALEAILYTIHKAYRMDSDWLTIKVSYGFNGIILRAKDVEPFASYLFEHRARRPPDHLQTEWWAGETAQSRKYKNGRSYFVFRYNLLEHIGIKSSLRSTEMRGFGVCGQEMNTDLMFQVDAFDSRKCGHTDMCPCHEDDKKNNWLSMENKKKIPAYKFD